MSFKNFSLIPTADYADACNAIREKTDRVESIVSGEMGALIRGITSGGMYASIFVTGLSESDTVTASYGEKTKVAVWNSTESRFEITGIADTGTWTVTATNGEETVTQDVLVDGAFEYEIEMAYTLWLYREGDECEDVTGGWIAITNNSSYWSSGTITKNETSINLYADRRKVAAIRAANMFDLTPYSKAVITVDDRTGSGTTSKARFVIYASEPTATDSDVIEAEYDIGIGETGKLELDISSLSGSKYVVVDARADASSGNTATSSLTFSGVRLEI